MKSGIADMRQDPPGSPKPAQVLSDYAYLLPESGTALDLACGRGGNALFLARRWALQGARLGYLEGRNRWAGPPGKIRGACDRDPCV